VRRKCGKILCNTIERSVYDKLSATRGEMVFHTTSFFKKKGMLFLLHIHIYQPPTSAFSRCEDFPVRNPEVRVLEQLEKRFILSLPVIEPHYDHEQRFIL
jgi:hypothetical protein